MDISTLNAGDEVYVFSRSRDRYLKLPVRVGAAGLKFVEIPSDHAWRRGDIVVIAEGVDVVTAEELPAAKKRHAARRKAEKAAEAERVQRETEGGRLASSLYALGAGLFNYGECAPGRVYRDGSIEIRLTVEQARVLLGALKGKV
jgi:hypothetical protein